MRGSTASTPLVGSSSSRTRGARISTRAKSSFCWLPPERCATEPCGEAALTLSARIASRMALRSRSPLTMPRLREAGEVADGDVGADRQVEEQAVALAVLGQERDAGGAGVARRADRDRAAVDADLARGRHAAVDAGRISLRPEPRRPARPTISPAATLKLTSWAPKTAPGWPATLRFRTSSRGRGSGGGVWAGKRRLQALAGHREDEAAPRRTRARAISAATWPSRSTVARSQIASTSGRRWVM